MSESFKIELPNGWVMEESQEEFEQRVRHLDLEEVVIAAARAWRKEHTCGMWPPSRGQAAVDALAAAVDALAAFDVEHPE